MIDPRAPRFSAGITAALLLTTVLTSFAHPTGAGIDILDRVLTPPFLLLTVLSLLFLWGATAGVQRHPFGWLFRMLVPQRGVRLLHRLPALPGTHPPADSQLTKPDVSAPSE